MTNQELYEAAIKAINRVFTDQSASVEEARSNLVSLAEEVAILIEALGYAEDDVEL